MTIRGRTQLDEKRAVLSNFAVAQGVAGALNPAPTDIPVASWRLTSIRLNARC
jgi:hypothetical protein